MVIWWGGAEERNGGTSMIKCQRSHSAPGGEVVKYKTRGNVKWPLADTWGTINLNQMSSSSSWRIGGEL